MQVGRVSPKSHAQGQRVRCENGDFCLQIGDLPIGKKFSKVASLRQCHTFVTRATPPSLPTQFHAGRVCLSHSGIELEASHLFVIVRDGFLQKASSSHPHRARYASSPKFCDAMGAGQPPMLAALRWAPALRRHLLPRVHLAVPRTRGSPLAC